VYFHLCLLGLVLSLDTAEKSLALSSLCPFIKYFYTCRSEPSLLLPKQFQLAQHLPVYQMLQAFNCICGKLDLLLYICVCLVLGSPELPWQCRVERRDGLPWPAGSAVPNVAQEFVDILHCKGMLLASIQLHRDLCVLFCKAALQPVGFPQVLVPGLISSPGAGLGISLCCAS